MTEADAWGRAGVVFLGVIVGIVLLVLLVDWILNMLDR